MSLRSKITWVLVAVIAVFALVIDRIQENIFLGRFQQVENQIAEQDLQRAARGIEEEIADLDAQCHGMASWTPMFQYAEKPQASFIQAEFAKQRLGALGLDLVAIVAPPRTGGTDQDDFLNPERRLPKVLWSTVIDPNTGRKASLADFPKEYLSSNHPILQLVGQRGSISGVLQTELHPLLVSAYPILRSDGQGSQAGGSAGVLILGRFLGEDLEAVLEERTRTDLRVWQVDGRHEVPGDIAAVLPKVTASAKPHLDGPHEGSLFAYGSFDDIRSRPEILLRATVPSDITQVGSLAVRSGALSLLTAGGVLLLVLMALLKKIVLDPISALTDHAVRTGSEEGYRGRCPLDRSDELGTLSSEFDTMLDRLDQAKRDLMDTARRAGMSEIATGILHNVGNVLNSVNISASMASQQAEEMSLDDLEQLAQILNAHANDLAVFVSQDPQGQHMLPFLQALTGQLSGERDLLRKELANLGEGVDHICDLIKSQQAYAIQSDLQESLSIRSVLEEAVHITEKANVASDGVDVRIEMEEIPQLEADRHRLLEILVNVIQNGRQAMVNAETPAASIVVACAVQGERLVIQVRDNGPGIPEETLNKIFNLGFTTKPTGMGYGLHTAANAATEMKGQLSATSSADGATFTLDIPFQATAFAS